MLDSLEGMDKRNEDLKPKDRVSETQVYYRGGK